MADKLGNKLALKATASVVAPTPVSAKPDNTIKTATVEAAIEKWRVGLVSSKQDAQAAAVLALEHCYIHRTAAQVRAMLAVIEKEGKDYVRRAPFTFWLVEFAPVKMVKKTKTVDEKEVKYMELEFDKDSKFVTTDGISDLGSKALSDAENKDWWTMSKDKEPDAFSMIRFDARILGLANKALKDIDESGEDTSPTVRNHVLGIKTQFEGYVAVNKATAA